MNKQFTFILSLLFFSTQLLAQSKQALFIGNSYTAYNNLPQIVQELAYSLGDTLVYDAYTPGGTTFMGHANNATTLAKITGQDWDYVVLQGQSQEPSFPQSQVESQTFPFAASLCDAIRANNNCTRPVFYRTWGRENGDANNCAVWPPVCTYEGMDSLLDLRYRTMADANEALLSPVGNLWRYIRNNHPAIDLYANDGSHPSPAGSFAAACSFYTIFFQKDPSASAYTYNLDEATANAIKQAAKLVVFDSLSNWNVGTFDPVAAFDFTIENETLTLQNQSAYSSNYWWNFGDENTSTEENPVHNYSEMSSNYTVTLIADHCALSDTVSQEVGVVITAVEAIGVTTLKVFPNPVQYQLHINTDDVIGRVEVFSADGRLVFKHQEQGLQMLDVSRLTKGSYILNVYNEEGQCLSVSFVKG